MPLRPTTQGVELLYTWEDRGAQSQTLGGAWVIDSEDPRVESYRASGSLTCRV